MALSKIQVSSMADNTIHGRRNLIINGSAQCWQRSTSSSSTGYTSADRWSYYAPSSLAISRSTDVPTGFQYAISISGGGDSSGITQKIEASTCKQLVGATITVSFYLKQTTGSGTDKIAVALSRANSEDSFGGTTSISSQTISTTSSYARYTCTFTSLPSEVANGLQLTIKSNGSGSVVYLITGVQLEVGQATPFEHLSFGETLALCQRYYYHTYSYGTPAGTTFNQDYESPIIIIGTGNHGMGVCNGVYPVEMRVAPTLSFYSSDGTANKIRHWGGAHASYGTVNRSTRQILGMSFNAGTNPEDFYSAALVCDAEL